MNGFSVHDLMRADAAQQDQASAGASAQRRGTATQRALSPLAERIANLPVQAAYSSTVFSGFVRLADFVIVLFTGLGVYFAYVDAPNPMPIAYPAATASIAIIAIIAFEAAQSYQPSILRSISQQGLRIFTSWSLVVLVAIASLFFLKIGNEYSRVWLAAWYGIGLVALMIGRLVVSRIVKTWVRTGRLDRRTVIVGGGEPAEKLIRNLLVQRDNDVNICGVFDDRNDERSPDIVAAFPKLGTVEDLVEFARRTRVDLVIVSLPISAETRILQMLRKLWVLPIDIRLSAHMSKLRFRPRSYSYISGVPVLDVVDKPIADWDIVIKWLFDKVVGTLALIALSPLMLAAAIAVKLDSRGPALFRQKRYGFNNELIEVYKFRSMYTDKSDAAAVNLVTRGDPRVTRVGRFIRKTSIDELPQLFNVVFKGNLSLVGPRPHATGAGVQHELYNEVVDGYFARHKVKPGITGWAQINGWRGETDTRDKIQNRVDHDIFYIENWSVLFDLTILIKTPLSLLKSENAY